MHRERHLIHHKRKSDTEPRGQTLDCRKPLCSGRLLIARHGGRIPRPSSDLRFWIPLPPTANMMKTSVVQRKRLNVALNPHQGCLTAQE